jgi:outer membrane protein TolC
MMPIFLLLLALQTSPAPAGFAANQPAADSIALSLPEALTRALRQGDEAKAAAAQVEVTDAQVTVARSSGLPQLRVNASQAHVYESARAAAVGSIFNQPNTYTAQLQLTQPLFQGGRVIAGARAASAVRNQSKFDQTETLAQVSLDVQRAYLTALLAGRLAEIQDTAYALAGQRLQQVQQFEKAGRASRYDVLRAQVEQTNLQPAVIQARGDVELALVELRRLINVPASQPVKLTTRLDTALVLGWVSDLKGYVGPINRAAVKSAEALSSARHAGVSVARADLLPTVSISGLIGGQAFPLSGFPTRTGKIVTVDCPPGSAADRVCTGQNGGWFHDKSFNITVGIPIFDGLRAKGNIDLASAQARLADLQLTQTRERVASEAASARTELDRAEALFRAQGQNAAQAAEAFNLATLRYNRGLATQLEVADAQLALTQARTNQARAVYDLYIAAASYARALGRPPQMFELPGAPRTALTPTTKSAP